jgi:predicted peptidase
LGGGGAWNFLNLFPNRVAATVPICAVGPSGSFDFNGLLGEPIWAHHGRFDTNVSPNVTRGIINTFLADAGIPAPAYTPLNTFGPDITYDFPSINLRYSDYQGSHDIWTRVYARPELYDWMFAQGAVPEPTATLLVFCAIPLAAVRVRGFHSAAERGR